MADDGAEVEKKKPDLPSKTPKPNSVSAKAGGGGGIVLALVKLKKRKQGEEGNVKKKKRILNEKGDEGEEGSDDLPEDVKEGAVTALLVSISRPWKKLMLSTKSWLSSLV